MSISSMLVPVSLDPREMKVFGTFVACPSVGQGAIVVTAVDALGMEGPVLAAEVERARERLAAMTSQRWATVAWTYEIRVVTGDTADAILALAAADDIDLICCGTEGKSVVDALFAGSMSERLFASGKVRTMTVRYELLGAVDDPRTLSRNFARRLVVPTDFSSATRAWLSAIGRPADAIGTVARAPPCFRKGAKRSERREAEVLLEGLLDMAREHHVNAPYTSLLWPVEGGPPIICRRSREPGRHPSTPGGEGSAP